MFVPMRFRSAAAVATIPGGSFMVLILLFSLGLNNGIGGVQAAQSNNNNGDRNVRRRSGYAEERGLQQQQNCAALQSAIVSPVHIKSQLSGLVLKPLSDNGVVQSYASASDVDDWIFTLLDDGFYRISTAATNENMIVDNGSTSYGGGIKVSSESFTDGRDKWCPVETGTAIYALVNSKSGLVIDIADASTIDGDRIHQWASLGVDNQLWTLDTNVATDDIPDWDCASFPPDVYYHIVAQHSGMALTVANESVESQANVHQYPVSPELNDNWRFEPSQHGFYHLIAEHSGMALTVVDNFDGANVVQAPHRDESNADDWCFIASGDEGAYEIRNRQNGISLDVEYSTNRGGNVKLWAHWGGDNQKFYVEKDEMNPPLGSDPDDPPAHKFYVEWEDPVATPIVAAAAANLPNGRIVLWSSFKKTGFQTDGGVQTWTAMYDPATGSIAETLVKTDHDMFCPGTSSLSNGDLMITGGSNSESTTFYDFRSDRWTKGPKLTTPRGYHSHTVLSDGGVFTVGGSWSGPPGPKNGEVWRPDTGVWTPLGGVVAEPMNTNDALGLYRSDNHYWLFLAPNGKVFQAGPSKQMHWITTNGSGSVVPSILRGDDDDAMSGNALMYDIGKILTLGGSPNYDSGNGSRRAYIIDINGPEATARRTIGRMNYKRTLCNSVLLPTSEVIVIGGQTQVKLFTDERAVYQAEIWNPATEKFRILAPMAVPRTYHSVAILMKDGRVLVAGGGLCDGCDADHWDFEILNPPYLFDSTGGLRNRPVIKSSTASGKAGSVIDVSMSQNKQFSFALVRTSAVTHSVNTDQRRIPLEVVWKEGENFKLQIPENVNVAVTGMYYLFAMRLSGVPSIASTFQITL